MDKRHHIQIFGFIAAALALGVVIAGCFLDSQGAGSPDSGQTVSFRDPDTGLEANIPAGFTRVRTHNLPGARIPIQIASFETERQVTSICQPGRIKDEIPTGGVLIQILSAGWKGPRRTGWPLLRRPVKLGSPHSFECGEAYNLFFRIRGRAFQGRIWTSPTGLSDLVKRQSERFLTSLKRPDGPAHAVAHPNRLEIDRSKVAFGRRAPFIALDCPTANSYRCDRIYFFVGLTRPAVWLEAWVAGRAVAMQTGTKPSGSGSPRERHYGWSGTVQPAGLTTPGSPLEIDSPKGPAHWDGRPSVRADIKVRAVFRNGRIVTETFPNELLAAGHG